MSTPARAPRRQSPRPQPARAQSPRPQARPQPARAQPSRQRPKAQSPRPQPRATAAATAPAERRQAEARPELHVVPERGRTLRLRILGTVAATLLFGALLGLAVFHAVLVQGQLHLDRTDDLIEQEQVRQSELRFDEARLAAPERIQAEAARLGMVQPDDRVYLQAVVPGAAVPPPETSE